MVNLTMKVVESPKRKGCKSILGGRGKQRETEPDNALQFECYFIIETANNGY